MDGLKTCPITKAPRITRLKVLAIFLVLMVPAAAGLAGVACWREAAREIADSEARGLAQMQISADAVARQTVILVKSLGDLERLALVVAKSQALDPSPLYPIALDALRTSMINSPLGVSELAVFDRDRLELLHEGIRHGLEPDADQQSGLGRPWKDRSGQIVLRWTSPVGDSKRFVVQVTLDPAALSNVIGVVLPDGVVAANGSIAGLITMGDRRLIARSQLTGRSLDENLQIRFSWMDEIVRQGFGSRRGMSMLYGYDMMVGYRTLPELGLIAAATSHADDMLALARLRAGRLREIPFDGLALGLVMVGLTVTATERRRTQARLAAEEHALAMAVAGQAEIETLVQSSPAMLFRGCWMPRLTTPRII